MPTGYSTVSGSNLVDATGAQITNATIFFQPCNNNGVPLSFQVNGNGQAISSPVSAQVTMGAFSVVLADTALTHPINIGYLVTVVDNLSNIQLLGGGYIIQPSGSTWDFDSFVPNVAALATIQTGPTGPAGPQGPAGGTGGSFGTTTPLAPSASGSVGTASTSSRSDHQHPSEINTGAVVNLPNGVAVTGGVASDRVTLGSTDALVPLLPYSPLPTAVHARVDAQGNVADWVDNTGTTHVEGGLVVNGGITTGAASLSLPATSIGNTLLEANINYGDIIPTPILSEIDSTGAITRYVDNAGVQHFPAGISIPLNDSFPQLTVGPTALEALTLPDYSADAPHAVIAEVDATGAIARSVDNAGNTTINGNLIAAQSVSAASASVTNQVIAGSLKASGGFDGPLMSVAGIRGLQLSTGDTIVSWPDRGRMNIYKIASGTGAITQLTFFGQCIPVGLTASGNILFVTDRNAGKHELWTMTTTGASQTFLASVPTSLPGTLAFLIMGQSLAEGKTATPVFPITNPNASMLNGGLRCPDPASVPLDPATIASLVPLVEAARADSSGETMATSFSLKMSQLFAAQGNPSLPLFFANTGQNGQPYQYIAQGTAAYTAGLEMLTAAASLCAGPFVVGALLCAHGESDQNIGNSAYAADLLTWQQDYQSDIKAITGQLQPIPLLIAQTSSWTSTITGDTATPLISPLIEQAAIANPGVVIDVGPSYFFPYSPDGTHLTNIGQNWRAEYYAKAYRKYLETGDFVPVRPLSATRTGNVIVINFAVPVQPLVIDTVKVTPPTAFVGGLNGFEFVDNSGATPTIISTVVTSPNQVSITLSATPTGSTKTIRYGWTGIAGNNAGPSTGPRGCLRDSDKTPSNYGYDLSNWCVHFSMNVA